MGLAAGVLVLALLSLTSGVPQGPRRPRQAQDVSSLPEDYILCLLTASADPEQAANCDILSPETNEPQAPVQVTPQPTVPQPGNTDACTCVLYWQCDDNVISAGPDATLLAGVDVRNNFMCSVPEEVCCERVKQVAVNPAPPPEQIYQPTCGVHKPQGFGANFQGFGDRQSQFGEFPWMVALMQTQVQGVSANVYKGGGSLISPQVVLTAAHYVYDLQAQDILVRLGEWNLKETSEPVSHQDIAVTSIVSHPQFRSHNLQYDVALLFLSEEAQLGPTVDTICLPPPGYSYVGPGCFTGGWGKDVFDRTGKYQQILKSIDLPAVTHSECEAAFRLTRLGPRFRLHDSFMCAGGEEKDLCTGDGGSPLVCPMPGDPTRYVQAGLSVWGIGCGVVGRPGVYADVSKVVDWIQQQLDAPSDFSPPFDVRFKGEISAAG